MSSLPSRHTVSFSAVNLNSVDSKLVKSDKGVAGNKLKPNHVGNKQQAVTTVVAKAGSKSKPSANTA
jgi:hypothetical protein